MQFSVNKNGLLYLTYPDNGGKVEPPNYDGFDSIEAYLDDLWWFMHNPFDIHDKQAWAFGCYLDESGTDDLSPYTVVAGLLLNRHNFISLGVEWNTFLMNNNIKYPIHMKDFGRPHGKLGYLKDEERYLLFAYLAGLINSHKIYSIAGIIDQEQYREILKLNKRKEMSPYGFCFMLCVYANHIEARNNRRKHDIGYLMSEVSEHKGQIFSTHAVMRKMQEEEPLRFHVGRLTFEYPKYVPALQAADIIAWGVNRKLRDMPFDQGYDFIEHIIIGDNHVQHSWEEGELQKLAIRFMEIKEN